MVYWIKMNSPIGDIHLAARDDKLVYCASAREKGSDMFIWLEKYLADEEIINKENELLRQAKGQLEDYFLGKNKTLDVDLGGPEDHSLWGHQDLWRDCQADWQAPGPQGHWPGQPPQPHLLLCTLTQGHRRRWRPGRLWWRHEGQGLPPRS